MLDAFFAWQVFVVRFIAPHDRIPLGNRKLIVATTVTTLHAISHAVLIGTVGLLIAPACRRVFS